MNSLWTLRQLDVRGHLAVQVGHGLLLVPWSCMRTPGAQLRLLVCSAMAGGQGLIA